MEEYQVKLEKRAELSNGAEVTLPADLPASKVPEGDGDGDGEDEDDSDDDSDVDEEEEEPANAQINEQVTDQVVEGGSATDSVAIVEGTPDTLPSTTEMPTTNPNVQVVNILKELDVARGERNSLAQEIIDLHNKLEEEREAIETDHSDYSTVIEQLKLDMQEERAARRAITEELKELKDELAASRGSTTVNKEDSAVSPVLEQERAARTQLEKDVVELKSLVEAIVSEVKHSEQENYVQLAQKLQLLEKGTEEKYSQLAQQEKTTREKLDMELEKLKHRASRKVTSVKSTEIPPSTVDEFQQLSKQLERETTAREKLEQQVTQLLSAADTHNDTIKHLTHQLEIESKTRSKLTEEVARFTAHDTNHHVLQQLEEEKHARLKLEQTVAELQAPTTATKQADTQDSSDAIKLLTQSVQQLTQELSAEKAVRTKLEGELAALLGNQQEKEASIKHLTAQLASDKTAIAKLEQEVATLLATPAAKPEPSDRDEVTHLVTQLQHEQAARSKLEQDFVQFVATTEKSIALLKRGSTGEATPASPEPSRPLASVGPRPNINVRRGLVRPPSSSMQAQATTTEEKKDPEPTQEKEEAKVEKPEEKEKEEGSPAPATTASTGSSKTFKFPLKSVGRDLSR